MNQISGKFSDAMERVLTGPTFDIQPNWNEILKQEHGEIFVSCQYRSNLKKGKKKYGKIIRKETESTDEYRFQLTATNDFLVNLLNSAAIVIGMKNVESTCLFLAPVNTYKNIHDKSVISIDISAESVCASVSGDDECKIVTWIAAKEEKIVTSRFHNGNIHKCRWFPTGHTIISFGGDTNVSIWCSETCRSPVILSGHSGIVTDIAFVDKGQNIVSVSKDGFCKLWNCRDQRCITDIIHLSHGINCCSLVQISSLDDLSPPHSQNLIIFGCDDGSIYCFNIENCTQIFHIKVESPARCSCSISNKFVAVGFANGRISLLNVPPNDDSPILISWLECDSPALCIIPFYTQGFFVGHENGLCIYRSILNLDWLARLCLSNSQGFAVNNICCDAKFVYTACADSNIRIYHPHSFIEQHFSFTNCST